MREAELHRYTIKRLENSSQNWMSLLTVWMPKIRLVQELDEPVAHKEDELHEQAN
jgi:hypothetical protein